MIVDVGVAVRVELWGIWVEVGTDEGDGELDFAIAATSETVTPSKLGLLAMAETTAFVKSAVVGTVSRPSIIYVTFRGPCCALRRRRRTPKTISPESMSTTFVMVVTHVVQLVDTPDVIAFVKAVKEAEVNVPPEKAESGREESVKDPTATGFSAVVVEELLSFDAERPKARPKANAATMQNNNALANRHHFHVIFEEAGEVVRVGSEVGSATGG